MASSWPDTQTKAMLDELLPDRLAPPDTDGFSLVLLLKGPHAAWVARSITHAADCSDAEAWGFSNRQGPVLLRSGLSLENALLGQFELICCDSVSVFLRDEVARDADQEYLTQLYADLLRSPEFEEVELAMATLPETEMGQRYAEQFLGGAAPRLSHPDQPPRRLRVMFKKAKAMLYWAKQIGAQVVVTP